MARLEFRLPDIGEGIVEAEIAEWHAQPGDAVAEGQVVVSVMTDKATVEMEAPAAGTLVEQGGEVGQVVAVGELLFALDRNAAAAKEEAPLPHSELKPEQRGKERARPLSGARASALPANARRALASPAVRQRAKHLGINLAHVPAVGGRVSHEDLDNFVQRKGSDLAGVTSKLGPQGEEIPVSGLRRRIAQRMQESKQHIPHFTYVEEIDVTSLERQRQILNRGKGPGQRLHLLPLLVTAVCRAVRDHPMLNAHYDDTREIITRFDAVHVGIATQTKAGLMVPVLTDAQALTPEQIGNAIARLAARARAGEIGMEELSGSTITITSLGKLGGIAATPIINRPEVAILAPHRVIERLCIIAGNPEPRMIMNLSISCDHRIIDGYVAASFIQSIKHQLENPNLAQTAPG